MDFITSFNIVTITPLLKLTCLIFIFLWYEGCISCIKKTELKSLHIFSPIIYSLVLLYQSLSYLFWRFIDFVMVFVHLYRWWCSGFWYTLKNQYDLSLRFITFTTVRTLFWPQLILILKGLAWSLDFVWAYFVYICIKLPFLFTWISLLSFHITWVLCVYFYRIYTNTELYPAPRNYNILDRWLLPLYNHLQLRYLDYCVSSKLRASLWDVVVGRFNLNFFFLPRYYKINNLMWQDGFLIDFLQKKVADRWVRTFVIFSGYLFNERWLFDLVVRLYIDLIIWPTYKVSLYEFNSVAPTITNTLLLLILLVIIIYLYYFTLLIL